MIFKELKEIRLQNGLTQQEMADKLDVSLNYYNKLERGHRNPSFKLIRRICEKFDLQLFGSNAVIEVREKQSKEKELNQGEKYIIQISEMNNQTKE